VRLKATPVVEAYQISVAMSALPPKADMCGATRDVRFGPIADISNLFDHFVSAREQRRRHIKTD
jgi:hypothetical protein